ncbi:hypothetical protein CBER1_07200 [Cercospora berteroae]|uniref:Uncharacterized protein n=1 Tax=Cercospora berteroae TaxID=357750 RepID=A0A2S6BRY5_9PEZI|nr:hypothetical protein CBER1_07200 [Cercospora berteroae]
MTDTTTFVPTDDDVYSHFDEGSLEWKACRERDSQDRLAVIALDEMFDTQKQGGEGWLAWLEKHRGSEARAEVETKRRLCQEEQDRYCQWKDWISLQRELQEKEYCAIPVYFRVPWKQWETEWNRLSWQAEEDYRQRIDDIWSGKYRGEGGENEHANEAEDGTVTEPEKLAESSESAESLRNDSVVELPKLELPDSSPPVDDQSSKEFPSLPSGAGPSKDKLESPHPKSLYRTPNPIRLASPPPPAETTISKVETPTRQTRRHLLAASFTTGHGGRDDLAGPRTVALKKRPVARSPKAAKQQIKVKPTLDTTVQDDASERPEEMEMEQPAKKEHINPAPRVSTPKKQKKPTTETSVTPAPVVISGPISGRKRKVKSFTSSPKPPAPQTPQVSIPATACGAASAATPTPPARTSEAESRKAAVHVSGATKRVEESKVAAERNVAGEGSGERIVKFVSLLSLLILAFFLGYALGI